MRKESCIKIKTRKNKPRIKKELNILIKHVSIKKNYICHLIHTLELDCTSHSGI